MLFRPVPSRSTLFAKWFGQMAAQQPPASSTINTAFRLRKKIAQDYCAEKVYFLLKK